MLLAATIVERPEQLGIREQVRCVLARSLSGFDPRFTRRHAGIWRETRMGKRRDKGDGSVYAVKRNGKVVGARGYIDLGWEDGKRKRKYFSGKTEREVKLKLAEARRAHERGTLPTGPE